MSNFLYYLAAFGLVIGILVVVHEFGHYLVARWAGVRVLRFSVGFGRPLLMRKLGRDGTEWCLAAFPLGGYVKMLDEREGPVDPQEAHRAFNRQSVWRRIAIVAAGPMANFLLAIVLYWGIFANGSEEPRALLGPPVAASAAALAGVQNGERVLKVAGESVESWQEMRWTFLRRAIDLDVVELEVLNSRNEITVRRLNVSAARAEGWESEALDKLGLTFYRPELPAVLGKINPGSAAERAGLQSSDEVLTIDGAEVQSWLDVVQTVRQSPGRSLQFGVLRGDETFRVAVVPDTASERGREIGRIGVGVKGKGPERSELMTVVRYDPLVALGKALDETWDKSVFSLVMLGKMVTGEVSWRNLSGPVTIADYAGQSARMGFDYYVKFLALVSISLGVLNLLPIPVLDGGHLLYYFVEIIKRGPLSERTMAIGQQIGLALMLTLMAFAFYNDIHRLISG